MMIYEVLPFSARTSDWYNKVLLRGWNIRSKLPRVCRFIVMLVQRAGQPPFTSGKTGLLILRSGGHRTVAKCTSKGQYYPTNYRCQE